MGPEHCDPLQLVLPVAADRLAWHCTARTVARDTNETVFHYEHRAMGRALRLDATGRVYGQDPEGSVRLFGKGGPLALAIALNAVYDGMDQHRPSRVALPDASSATTAHAPTASAPSS